MKRLFKKIICASLLLIIGCVLKTNCVSAEVFAEITGGGNADSVYVAGNPDLYPIEYYDEKSESYKGLIPEMLNEISEKTGIDFTYILAGKKNSQESLFENNQVEIVTGITSEDTKFEGLDSVIVLKSEYNGETIDYSIGFTKLMSKEKKEKISAAISEINDTKMVGWLVGNAKADLLTSQKTFAFIILIGIVVIVLALIIATIVMVKKHRKKTAIDRLIDVKTGVGNSDYYTYAFENFIGEQAKNLYNLAYISFETTFFKDNKNELIIEEIDKYAATKLSASLVEGDYLAHFKNGVFVLLFQAENKEISENRIEELLSNVNSYISEYINDWDKTMRVGYCRFCDCPGIDAETAIYNAKQGYIYAESNNLPYYVGTKSQIAINKKNQRLMEQIDDALKDGDFKTYLQFFLDGETNKFCGAEVLSRWQNREYGLLRPDEYMDVLTKSKKIVDHDYRIFEEVCKILEGWNKPPFDKLFLTCNFTRISVTLTDFTEKIAEISNKYSFSHDRLIIEITESASKFDAEIISENIKKIHNLGFKVAIDDMGTGFSSLSDIYDNKIDIVKIERDFIATCVTERRWCMLSDLILLIHNAGAKVVCEGVETEEQFNMLKDMKCDIMQGFYHSRVLPFSECERFFLSF